MRPLVIALVLVGGVSADIPRPPGVPRPLPGPPPILPAPPQEPAITLHLGDSRPGAPRLVLPARIFGEVDRPLGGASAPTSLIVALALSLAAVLAGFRVVGKKLPLPRLALGSTLAFLLVFAFGGCGTNVSDETIITHVAPQVTARDGELTGTLILERGTEEAATLTVPLPELQKLTRP